MMRYAMKGLLVALALTGLHAADGAAQGRQGMGAGMVAGTERAEHALRLRQALDLTEAQVSQLEALRQQQVVHRQAMAEAGVALRSRVAAGELTAVQARDELQEMRQAMRETQGEGALRNILTAEQRQILARQARASRGAALRGGAGMRGQGAGMRGGVQGGRMIPGAGQSPRGGMLPGGAAPRMGRRGGIGG